MDTLTPGVCGSVPPKPKQFIITSDYDFKAALNRPWQHGVKYILLSNPSYSDADAINIRYPSLWYDGAGIAKLVMNSMTAANVKNASDCTRSAARLNQATATH